MGSQGYPLVIVLTGSSYDQNINFFDNYGFGKQLEKNPAIDVATKFGMI